jgi:hypothetical protein
MRSDPPTVSFASDIRRMFTNMDVAHMKSNGIDLSSHDDVMNNANDILDAVSAGRMPPKSSGEPRWTDDMCSRFRTWMSQGYPA